MNRYKLLFVVCLAALCLTACGPTISVQNDTSVPVRVIVTAQGKSDVLSPSPGESSSADASEGPYSVTIIPDQEWLDYAKTSRKYLNDQLANANNLSGAQLLDVVKRLKDIAARMKQFEDAANSGAHCGGRISQDGGGAVTVSIGASGALVVACK